MMISWVRQLTCPLYIFFFNATATTEIYTLSLHDALPICHKEKTSRPWCWPTGSHRCRSAQAGRLRHLGRSGVGRGDRKSTRLNSSHLGISYAVFCLKKKKKYKKMTLFHVIEMMRRNDYTT